MHTEAAIENLVNATLGAAASEREKHIFRESLRNLVRIANAEYKAEMQASVDKAIQVMPNEATLLV